MRIGIDYWPAATHAPGIGRYVRELVRALARAESLALALYDVGPGARTIPERMLGLPAPPGLPASSGRVRRVRLRIPRRALDALRLGADRIVGGCDLFQRAFPGAPRVARARTCLTLAELPPAGSAGAARLGALARAHDGLLVAGEAARAAACQRLDLDPDRVHVVGVGCEHWVRELGGAPSRPDGPLRRIVALGRVDAVRRPLELFRAAAALAAGGAELELVYAGRPGDASAALERALAGARFPARWLASPPEHRLPRLVCGATAVVQLETEAWTAVTPLEALAGGAAVVATALPAFREVLGDAAEWIVAESGAPPDPTALAAALERALESGVDPAARAQRRAFAAEHSWARAARLTADAWRRILARE